jgi:hypothetical protein
VITYVLEELAAPVFRVFQTLIFIKSENIKSGMADIVTSFNSYETFCDSHGTAGWTFWA